jgi:hypothetical protein
MIAARGHAPGSNSKFDELQEEITLYQTIKKKLFINN